MLRKGLKALGGIRDDVVHRQSRVFQALLGAHPEPSWSNLVRGDAGGDAGDGERDAGRFEAIFDQRVAQALAHLDMPSPAALRSLVDDVAALKAEVAKLAGPRRKR
jgi:hypothetical protein